jgi:hypothetical protein
MKNINFKIVNGFTAYQININGDVLNLKTCKTLKSYVDTRGYVRIDLQQKIDGVIKYRRTSIHRLLAENFIENPNNYKYVNHIDANKLNNNLNNLEWCTQKQNLHHSRYITKNGSVISKQKILKIVEENPALNKNDIINMLILNCR